MTMTAWCSRLSLELSCSADVNKGWGEEGVWEAGTITQ